MLHSDSHWVHTKVEGNTLLFSLVLLFVTCLPNKCCFCLCVSESPHVISLLLAMYRLEFVDGTPTFQIAWCPSYFRLIPRYPHGNTLLFSFSNLWKKSLMQTQLRPYSPGQFIRYIKSQFRLNLEHPSPLHKS